ncbi:alpha/beta hydrolase family protein [Nonomuraea gerenzanensis]|uniref:Probable lipase/esterase n=1 Tax=Nonomuraea gerenzanensis TaxID=93944 RepID=A0A1M4EI76_9ACTN|nr:alpha/beta hydrolase [Nonomuraea gerenzanensis]UBU10109.1 alpha/beta hydrolase [Nonomuraea gerenzanensis]SBO98482.1 probable lipase/esterase [Nonomuraea gerenzanensis]
MCDVLVIVGPQVVADAGLLGELARREFAMLGVRGRVVHAADAAHVSALAREAAVAVVVPAPGEQTPGSGVVVPVDLDLAEGATHIHGRGIAGLAWGIRHAVHRARHPSVRRVAYGASAEQWGELYLPEVRGEVPVVALVHGGYWRSVWAADLMEALCADLVGRGFAVWNLEYRRPDLHGWAATRHDVAAGLAALENLGPTTAPAPAAASAAVPGSASGATAGPEPGVAAGAVVPPQPVLDLDRVAVIGHSAGAQLALRAVADGARVALAVSLAGVLDLVTADRRWLSHGAVAAALGESARDIDAQADGDEVPDGGEVPDGELRASSPLLRLPLGVPQLVVQGGGDDVNLVDISRRYASAAREAGDEVTYLELPGDHQDVITPGTPIWQATATAITTALA